VADVRVYKGIDDNTYMTHFGRVMPPEDPRAITFLLPESRGMGIFSRFLRPEFVRRYHVALSPDAYSAFADMQADGIDHIKRVRRPVASGASCVWCVHYCESGAQIYGASHVLKAVTIPAFAKKLARVGISTKRRNIKAAGRALGQKVVEVATEHIKAGAGAPATGENPDAPVDDLVGLTAEERVEMEERQRRLAALRRRLGVVQAHVASTKADTESAKPGNGFGVESIYDGGIDMDVVRELADVGIAATMHRRGISLRHLGCLRYQFWFPVRWWLCSRTACVRRRMQVAAPADPVFGASRMRFREDPRTDLQRGAQIRTRGYTVRCVDAAALCDIYLCAAEPSESAALRRTLLRSIHPLTSGWRCVRADCVRACVRPLYPVLSDAHLASRRRQNSSTNRTCCSKRIVARSVIRRIRPKCVRF
jgi:hypothetical protein